MLQTPATQCNLRPPCPPCSFYFVGDKLIMHNKAYYKYVVEDATAQSKSYDKYNPGHKGAKGAKGAKVRHHPQPQSPFDANA